MERIVLPKRIAQNLRGFEGKAVEDKINYLAEQTAKAKLRECNERISRFESLYGRTFADFESAWDGEEIKPKHDYKMETDFIEWEALEQEKGHWLSVIRSCVK